MLIMDNYSRYVWIYFMKTKDHAYSFSNLSLLWLRETLIVKLSVYRPIEVGIFIFYLLNLMILVLFTIHIFERNRATESKHQRVVQRSLILLFHPDLSMAYWLYTFRTFNRYPSQVLLQKLPYVLDYSFLRGL